MKLDKETLIKHKFWILLGFCALLWLIATFTLKAAWSEPLEKSKKEYDSAKTNIGGVRNPKNHFWWDPWNKYGDIFEGYKDQVWREARAVQEKNFLGYDKNPLGESTALETWPEGLNDDYPLYPTENVSPNMENRQRYRDDYYRKQFEPENLIDVETGQRLDKLLGPVAINGGMAKHFPLQTWNKDTAPSIEECWIAQEDLWVRREMMAILGHLQSRKATLRLIKKDDKPGNNLLCRYLFENDSWQLDLKIIRIANNEYISTQSTIKNIHPSKRTQWLVNPITFKGVIFTLRSGDGTWKSLEVKGVPLAYNAVAPIYEKIDTDGKTLLPYQLHPMDLKDLNAAVQEFDWDTSPIREVVSLAAPYQSHRTQTMPLKKRAYSAKDAPKVKADEKRTRFGRGKGGNQRGGPGRGGPGRGGPGRGGPGRGGPGRGGPGRGGPGGAASKMYGDMPMPPGGKSGGSPPPMPGSGKPGGGMPNSGMPNSGMPGGGRPGSGMPSSGMPGMYGQVPGQAAIPDEDKTSPNGLDRRRYVHVTPQCRHLPLAMVVIVEPEFLPDLLTEVVNSRLRIQITQVQLHRVRNVKPNRITDKKEETKEEPGRFGGKGVGNPVDSGTPNYGNMPRPGSRRGPRSGGRFTPPMPMGNTPMFPGGGFPRPASNDNSESTAQPIPEPNLVEVAIYGIASLFERPPPPKATNDQNYRSPAPAGNPNPVPAGNPNVAPVNNPNAAPVNVPRPVPNPALKPGPAAKP